MTRLALPTRVLLVVSAATLAGSLYATPAAQEVPKRLCMVDEAPKAQGLVAFRDRLLAAARSRDIERLRPLVWDRIYLEKEGPRGFAALRRSHLNDKETTFWRDLENMLLQGGVFEIADSFCAPFYSCPVPPEWAHALIILGQRVPAYQAPTRSSPIVGYLSCDIYRLPEGDLRDTVPPGNKDFVPAPVDNGRWAFVETKYVGLSESFLYIGKRNGKWLLVHYGAFD